MKLSPGAKTLLFIDDDREVLDNVSLVLEAKGWKIERADCLEKGVEAFHRSPSDVVLSDLMMPGGGGIEVLQAVRKIDPRAPVIIATGYGSFENSRRAVRAGSFDFVKKPFDFEELTVILEKALRYRREASYAGLPTRTFSFRIDPKAPRYQCRRDVKATCKIAAFPRSVTRLDLFLEEDPFWYDVIYSTESSGSGLAWPCDQTDCECLEDFLAYCRTYFKEIGRP